MKQYAIILCIAVIIGCKDNAVKKASFSDVALPWDKDNALVVPVAPQPIEENIYLRIKAQPELAQWVNQLDSTSISEMLQLKKGPFTILAPSEEAFTKSDSLIQFKDIESIKKLIKSHIISEKLSSSYLVKGIRYRGSYSVTSMAGTKLTFTKREYDILVNDEFGNEVLIGKSDILGTNGVLHLVDGILGLD